MTIDEFLIARLDEAEENAHHLAAMVNPDFALRDVETKRAVITKVSHYCWNVAQAPCGTCDRVGCVVLRYLAEPYADHPDYLKIGQL